MSEVMARGPNFVFAREFIEKEYGTTVWERIVSAMPAEGAAVWRGVVLVSGSYPFSAFKQMLVALAEEVGVLPEQETASMYEFIADRSLTTVHRFFFHFAEPSFVLRRYPMLWKRFFQTGAVSVPQAEGGKATLVFNLPEIFLDWIRPACLGYSTKAVEMAGGRDLQLEEVERREIGGGEWRISFELSWQQP